MRLKYVLLAVFCMATIFSYPDAHLAAQDDETCDTLATELTWDNRLLFIDPQNEQTVREEQLPYPFSVSHSPDCRFLIGQSTQYNACDPGVIIWDAATGDHRLTLDGFCDRRETGYPLFSWKPDNAAVLIAEWYSGWNVARNDERRLIWYPDTDQIVELEDRHYFTSGPNLFQADWDEARGWLWSSGYRGIFAFDIQTGEQVIEYPNVTFVPRLIPRATTSNFTFSPDRTRVIVHGQKSWDERTYPAMTVYTIATGEGVQVNVERNGAGSVAISPDNRFLIMSYVAIRVWDLHNLPEDVEDRLPIYRLSMPRRNPSDVRFIDSTTLEATGGDITMRWDLRTGAPIP